MNNCQYKPKPLTKWKILERTIIISLWIFILLFLIPRSCEKQDKNDSAKTQSYRLYVVLDEQTIKELELE